MTDPAEIYHKIKHNISSLYSQCTQTEYRVNIWFATYQPEIYAKVIKSKNTIEQSEVYGAFLCNDLGQDEYDKWLNHIEIVSSGFNELFMSYWDWEEKNGAKTVVKNSTFVY